MRHSNIFAFQWFVPELDAMLMAPGLYDRVWEAKKKKKKKKKKEWQTDAVWLSKAKNFAFFIRNLCMEYIFLPFQNTVNKTVRRNFGIDFFRSIISKPTELNGDFIRFFYCGSKIVSFHPAKGRLVHVVFIILSASTEMCSANWYRWPFFYCCSVWCFQLSRLSPPYAIAKSTEALIFPSIYLN